ncbi:MAG: DUF1285 domain-containing protein [Halioglobus sp.]|nr:DUF1285 domain-containing protein [Halioglobus sp.]
MQESLDTLATRLDSSRNYEAPPLHLWHPELSGDIPIYIDAQGDWYHDGTRIERESLVRLFASILRREEDGEYYLLTPAEKWRIKVERHALLVTDISSQGEGDAQRLVATLNTGRQLPVSAEHPLFLDDTAEQVAALCLPHGLTALCTRAAWYRLVELAQLRDGYAVLTSGDYEFRLPLA